MIEIRGYSKAEDFNFIINSWLKSYRVSPSCRDISNGIYFAGQTDIIENLLRNPETIGMILCAKDDPDQIMGYAIFDNSAPVLHYLYVKHPFRKRGFGKLLFSIVQDHHRNKRIHVTSLPRNMGKMVKKYHMVYNPYVIKYQQSPSVLGQSQANDPSVAQD
jgi:GNAT superfamily N-acetyltransferase